MRYIAIGIAIGFFVMLAAPVVVAIYLVQDQIPAMVADVWQGIKIAAKVCAAVLLVGGLAVSVYLLRRQSHEAMRQRDGAFKRERYYLVPWTVRLYLFFLGKAAPFIDYDPNTNLHPGLMVSREGAVPLSTAPLPEQLAYAQVVEGTRKLQALAPGDSVRSLPWGGTDSGKLIGNAATGKFLAGSYDKAPRPVQAEATPDAPQLPAPAPLSLPAALEQTEPNRWLLGQNKETGTLAVWQPDNEPHIAVIGGSGSGKTESTVSQLIVAARRVRWHPIVLDPLGGADLSVFQSATEWYETGPDVFVDQLRAVSNVMDERTQLIKAAGVPRVGLLSNPPPQVLVLVDEFGVLMGSLSSEAKAEAINIIERFVRVGRKYGIHLALADQSKKSWPDVTGGISPTLTYRMGDYKGAATKAYDADTLAVGQFQMGRKVFDAWHVTPQVGRIMQSIPPLLGALLGSSQPVHGDVHGPVHSLFTGDLPHVEVSPSPAMNTPMNYPTTVDGWYEWTLENYLPTHPELLQTDSRGRGVGVLALAVAMGEYNGKNVDDMKGTASEIAKRLRSEVNLPGGDKLGTDISTAREP